MTVENWAWLSLGVGLGFTVGILWDDALIRFRNARKERKLPTRRLTKPTYRQMLGGGLILVGVLQVIVGALLVLTYVRTAEYTECTASWQQQFGSAYAARIEASTEVSTAIDDIVTSVGAEDPTAFNVAVTKYLQVRAQQDKDRASNPYPELPQTLCGSPRGG